MAIFYNQALKTEEGFKNSHFNRPSRLFISRHYEIFLLDYDRFEVKMQPLIKTVFIFFLRHPEGISFYDLQNYASELRELYLIISPRTHTEELQSNIKRLINRQDNSMNEKISRIKELFLDIFSESIARHYIVEGKRGSLKKIKLNRDWVQWETGQRFYGE